MPSITIRISDADMAAIDARAAELSRRTRVNVGRSACVRVAVDAYLAGGSVVDRPLGQRPLPPRTRTRAVA